MCQGPLKTTGDYWRLLEITEDYWRLLKITGDYWRLLEITEDYWRLLEITWYFSARAIPSFSFSSRPMSSERAFPHVIQVRDLDPTRVMAQFVQAANNKGRPLHVDGL